MITPHLDRRKIVALRHGSRRLSMSTSEALNPTFEYLATSCSRIGFGRLRALNLNPEEEPKAAVYRTIKRITIHLPTPAELQGVMQWLPHFLTGPHSYENPYLKVYGYMRCRIHILLSRCPNLERLIITNEPLEYDRDRLGHVHDALPMRREPRLVEVEGIDPFLASVKNCPRRRPRTYGYEMVLSTLNYLRFWLPINLIIDYKRTRELDGHAFVTWDFKTGFPGRCHPALQDTAATMFGQHLDGQIDIPEILRCFVMGVTLKNGEDVDKSRSKQLYRYLEKANPYKLTFRNTL